MTTLQLLDKVFPKAKSSFLEKFANLLDHKSKDFGIVSDEDKANYLANVLEEVGEDIYPLEEILNYHFDVLPDKFKAFRNNNLAKKYGRSATQKANKEMIANIAYANRNGNGDVASGDGYKYRGRGLFQLTGKENYKIINDEIKRVFGFDFNIDKNPALVATDTEVAVLSSFAFWSVNKLQGKNIDKVVDKINKSTDSRLARCHHAKLIIEEINKIV